MILLLPNVSSLNLKSNTLNMKQSSILFNITRMLFNVPILKKNKFYFLLCHLLMLTTLPMSSVTNTRSEFNHSSIRVMGNNEAQHTTRTEILLIIFYKKISLLLTSIFIFQIVNYHNVIKGEHYFNLFPEPRYETAYACEGKTLKIGCGEGSVIHLIRANYGRFSITICNDHGNTDWSVNCMSTRSLRVLHSR